MALITNWENTRFGIPAPQSYTRITEINMQRRIFTKTPATPDTPIDQAGILSTHGIQFRTETFMTKEVALAGGEPIEFHGYTVFPTWEDTDIMAFCYNWLKTNVAQFKNATDA
jgi:hypothetical protein